MSTRVGYAGGTTMGPTYRNIGDHTETVEVVYDPAVVSYDDLLSVFWNGHSPTSRWFSQQYASLILYCNDAQKTQAEASLDRLRTGTGDTVYTQIVPANFTPAEDYHQKYYLKGSRSLADEYRAIYPDEDGFTNSTATARVNGYVAGFGTPETLEKELTDLGLSQAGQARLLELAEHGLKAVCPVP